MRKRIVACGILALVLAAGCGGGAGAGAGFSSGSSGSGGSGSGGSGSGGNQGSSGGSSSACSAMSAGQGASLNGFIPFASDNLWNKDISSAAVDANSAAIINFIGPNIGLHPDFGSGEYQGSYMGIPYMVVSGTQAAVTVRILPLTGTRATPAPMPIPAGAPIEGYPNPGNGDRHVLVLDNSNCFLYELYNSSSNNDGSWNADSAAVWDLLGDEQRPWTWTSADAAGLPIFPAWFAMTKSLPGKYNTPCASRCPTVRRHLRRRHRTGRRPRHPHKPCAHGDAPAPEGELRHFEFLRQRAGDSQCSEEVRHDYGG